MTAGTKRSEPKTRVSQKPELGREDGRPGARAAMCAPAAGCIVKSLADLRLGGIAPGLIYKKPSAGVGGFDLVKDSFPCCGATGLQLDPLTNVTRTCALPARIQTVRRLLQRFDKYWGESAASMPLRLPVGKERQCLERLAAIAKKTSKRGLGAFRPAADLPSQVGVVQKSPSSLWAVALAAGWRFGLKVHVVVFGKSRFEEFQPPPDADLVLVECVDKLWDAERADEFEWLVGYCYKADLPLWLDLIEHAVPVGSGTAKGADAATASDRKPPVKARQAFSRKIAALKARMPLSWLSPDCLSKLSGLTDGLLPRIARKSEKPAAGRVTSGFPKLPWDH